MKIGVALWLLAGPFVMDIYIYIHLSRYTRMAPPQRHKSNILPKWFQLIFSESLRGYDMVWYTPICMYIYIYYIYIILYYTILYYIILYYIILLLYYIILYYIIFYYIILYYILLYYIILYYIILYYIILYILYYIIYIYYIIYNITYIILYIYFFIGLLSNLAANMLRQSTHRLIVSSHQTSGIHPAWLMG